MSLPSKQRSWNVRSGAISALLAICVLIPSASARQASSDDTAKKPASAKPSTSKSSTTKRSAGTAHSSVHHSTRRKKSSRVRGQKKIDPERARTIQEALIREHYLSGEATGTWNQASEDAMRRYQADHGWQTKEVPDSRALISLGLGPSKDHLLNPESAMTTGPDTPTAAAPAATPTPSAPVTPVSTSTPTPNDPPHPQ